MEHEKSQVMETRKSSPRAHTAGAVAWHSPRLIPFLTAAQFSQWNSQGQGWVCQAVSQGIGHRASDLELQRIGNTYLTAELLF